MYSVGIVIKSLVCDQGPCNQSLAKKFVITEDKTYITYNNKICFSYSKWFRLHSPASELFRRALVPTPVVPARSPAQGAGEASATRD